MGRLENEGRIHTGNNGEMGEFRGEGRRGRGAKRREVSRREK